MNTVDLRFLSESLTLAEAPLNVLYFRYSSI